MPTRFDELKRQLGNAQAANKWDPAAINKIPDSVDRTTNRDIAVLAKLGYNDLSEGAKFGAAKDAVPRLGNVIGQIQNLAVPTSGGKLIVSPNGQPKATQFDGLVGAIGERFRANPNVLRQLDADFNEYGRNRPAAEARFMEAVKKDPNAMATAIRSYSGAEGAGSTINGQLETAMNRVLGAPPANLAPARPATPAPKATAPVTAAAEPRTPAPPRTKPASEEPTRPTTKPNPEPVAVAAEPSVAPTTSAPATAPASSVLEAGDTVLDETNPADAKFNISAEEIGKNGGLADQIANLAEKAFEGDKPAIEAFRKRMKADSQEGRQLRESIATNLNNNPEFVNQLKDLGASDAESVDKGVKLLQGYGRNQVLDLMANPDKLADDKFVDDLSGKMKMAGNFDFGGMLKGLMSMIEQFVGPEFMQALSGLFSGVSNMVGGMGKGGNFMSLDNSGGGMFSNLMAGFGQASAFGSSQDGMTQQALENGARAVNVRGSKEIRDGHEYDAQGNRVKETYKDKDGKERKRDKYDPKEDDRIEYTDANGKKHKGFQTEGGGFSEWQGKPVQFIVTRVNEKGVAIDGTNIIVKGNEVSITDADTGQPRAPRAEPDAGRQVAGGPRLKDPEMNPNSAMSSPNNIAVNIGG